MLVDVEDTPVPAPGDPGRAAAVARTVTVEGRGWGGFTDGEVREARGLCWSHVTPAPAGFEPVRVEFTPDPDRKRAVAVIRFKALRVWGQR